MEIGNKLLPMYFPFRGLWTFNEKKVELAIMFLKRLGIPKVSLNFHLSARYVNKKLPPKAPMIQMIILIQA